MAEAAEREPADPRRSLLAAGLIGVGVTAAVDEIVFHQLLAWHHFFDRSTSAVALFSDGLLHSAELIILVLGFFIGAGGFQLFDGIVDHKVLRLHQVRYVDNLLPYDLAWNGAGLLLLAVGFVLLRRARAERAPGR